MMNMAENCSVLDPWAYRSESAWISEAFSRENEVLARALQISLSDTSSSGAATPIASPDVLSAGAATSPFLLRHPHHGHLAPPALRPRNPLGTASPGRVSKRKSRASKRSPTTYINADPANFREMVQRVTGVQLGGEKAEPLVKPEPLRPAANRAALQQVCLPTLDTSSFLLDRGAALKAVAGSLRPPADRVPSFDLDALVPQAFPTLESWGAM